MKYLLSVIIMLASTGLFARSGSGKAMTANEVIEAMKSHLTWTWSAETVDTFISGNPDDHSGSRGI